MDAENEAKIREEKAKQYGPATFGHANLGLLWTALLQNHYQIKLDHPIPADLAMLMLAANKLNRGATPTPGHQDDYDDARVYVQLAREAREEIDRENS